MPPRPSRNYLKLTKGNPPILDVGEAIPRPCEAESSFGLSVNITSPAPGTYSGALKDLVVTATVSGGNGEIAMAWVSVIGTQIGATSFTQSGTTWTFKWTGVTQAPTPGDYLATVQAQDMTASVTQSVAVHLTG